jgi:ATP-binding cassette subfamily C protein CydD
VAALAGIDHRVKLFAQPIFSRESCPVDKRLLAEARARRGTFALVVVLSAGAAMVIAAQATVLSHVIRQAFLDQAGLSAVWGWLLLLGSIILLRALIGHTTSVSAARMAVTIKSDLRRRLIEHLARLGPSYVKHERSGELAITATEGIDALDGYFRDFLPSVVAAFLIPVTILVFVLPLDGLTFVVLLVTAPLIPLFMALIGMAAGALARSQYAEMQRLGAHFLDVMQGLTTLKLFNRSRYQLTTIGRMTDHFRDATLRVLRVAFLSAFMLEMLATLSVAIVAVEISVRLLNGGIGFEQALFLLVIAPEFYLPLRTLGARFHNSTTGTAAARRIFEVLETPVPVRNIVRAPIPEELSIQFDSVSVVYESGQRPALSEVSFSVQPGEHVALVGVSGSGKSTIGALLLKFITPARGSIRIGGVNLRDLDDDQWRRQIAWVSQKPFLFNMSIAENIRIGNPNATMEDMIRAARDATAHDFIMRFPQGYETLCGERGLRLSGGQFQRITLARAFLKAAPILLLDEATAHLDPQTEDSIQSAINRLARNRTVLFAAHRLATVVNADRILVLDGGHVVEQGTHAELVARDGIYRQMWLTNGDEQHESGSTRIQ